MHDGRLKVFVTAPAVEGAANSAVIEAVAKAFALRPHAVRIKSGLASRRKTLVLDDVAAADIAARLAIFA